MKKILLPAILLFIQLSGFTQSSQEINEKLSKLFRDREEIYFRFPVQAPEKLQELSQYLSVDHDPIREGYVYAYGYRRTMLKFLKEGISYQILTPPSLEKEPIMRGLEDVFLRKNDSSSVCSLDWNFFPTYEAYENLMQQFQTDFPDICRVDTIGQLTSGKLLLVAHLGDSLDVDEDEPEFFYSSTMHGDETAGYNLMLHLITYLLCNYENDAEIRQLMDEVDIYINPLANPDGTYAVRNNTVAGATRANRNGFDLNRNYPDPDDGPNPGGTQQEETSAFINYAAGRDFNIGANLHGGAEVANYPWDTYQRRHPDDDWWKYVCREYADTTQANSPAGFFNDLDNGITNGYDWFVISGGRQDYMNAFEYCREFTLELSQTKNVPSGSLENLWDYHKAALINYMEQSLNGLRGIVRDSISGEPLLARVFINGYDRDSSHVYSSLPLGNYHRYLFDGNYAVSFSAEDYVSKTINVSIQNGQASRLDVELMPEVAAGISDSKNTISFDIYPNPGKNQIQIEFQELLGPVEISVLDLSGRQLLQQEVQGRNSSLLEIQALASGMYLLRIETEESYGIRKFLKK